MKKNFAGLVFIAAMAVLAAGCGRGGSELPERIARVVAQPVQKRHFAQRYRMQANVQAKEKAEISSRVAGTLDEFNTDTGLKVKKGDLLFTVDHQNLRNDLLVQEAKLDVAKTNLRISQINTQIAKIVLDKAKRDFERYRTLYESNTVSEDAYERQNVNMQEALSSWEKALAQERYVEAQVKQEEANLASAQKKFDDSMSIAPFDAMVMDKLKERGEYVSVGTPIFKLENDRNLELSSRIIATYFHAVKPGVTRAIVYSMDGEKLCEGVVSYVSPNIDELTRTFEVKLDLPPDTGKIVSGMLCQVELILSEHDSYGVPTEAVLSRANNAKIVYVVRNGVAEPVSVKTGIADDDYTEILNRDDLDNDEVVVQGQAFLSKGDKVEFVVRDGGNAESK